MLNLRCSAKLEHLISFPVENIVRMTEGTRFCVEVHILKPFEIPAWSNTNGPVQSQKQASSLTFGFRKQRNCTTCVAKNKGADQLCSYCTADLHLCFRICRLFVFLCKCSNVVNLFTHAVRSVKIRKLNNVDLSIDV